MVGLEQWRHIATLGRDHYVRVVYAGYLMPFGHRASLIKVTERKFESVAGNINQRVAVLRLSLPAGFTWNIAGGGHSG